MPNAAVAHMRRTLAGPRSTDPDLIGALRDLAAPVRTSDDLAPLLDRVGNARVVLLGEATHGTLKLYGWRALLSARLIRPTRGAFDFRKDR
jgi:erythromycin esterase-like protein